MKIKRIFLVVTLIVSLATPICFARLGENKAEIIKRYGTPSQNGALDFIDPDRQGLSWVCSFGTDPMAGAPIAITAYLDGKLVCQVIEYRFSYDKFQFQTDSNIEAAKQAVLDLLEKNKQGKKWEPDEKSGDNMQDFSTYHWKRTDGGLSSWIRMGGGTLILESGDFKAANSKKQEENNAIQEKTKQSTLDNL